MFCEPKSATAPQTTVVNFTQPYSIRSQTNPPLSLSSKIRLNQATVPKTKEYLLTLQDLLI